MNDVDLDIELLFAESGFESHVEKGTIEMNIEYYNLMEEKMARLINENQKLKKQLEKYIRAEFKAKDELEKQRKEYQDVYKDVRIEIKGYKNQQKEFIEYLENEKNRLAKECSYTYEGSLGKLLYVNEDIFNEVNRILLKYKEIIGGDNK